jgi:hypothetical protein
MEEQKQEQEQQQEQEQKQEQTDRATRAVTLSYLFHVRSDPKHKKAYDKLYEVFLKKLISEDKFYEYAYCIEHYKDFKLNLIVWDEKKHKPVDFIVIADGKEGSSESGEEDGSSESGEQ